MGDLAKNHIEKVLRTVPTPVGEQKVFHLGETFKVAGKEVTIHNLGDAAVAAHLPNVYPSATLSMLEKQVALNGVTDTTIPGDMEFSLPMNSAIGHEVTTE